MPCYDPQVDENKQITTRAACEMARAIIKSNVDFSLSQETLKWIKDHMEYDARCGRPF
jgi:hypothetical protein